MKPFVFYHRVDPETGRSIVPAIGLGIVLKITARHVNRLAAAGVLPRRPDGMFEVRACIDAHCDHLVELQIRDAVDDPLQAKKAEAIKRRLDREAKELIDMPDALETVDSITGAFLRAVDIVGAECAAIASEPVRVETVISNLKSTLADKFATHCLALQTGKKKSR